MRGCSMAKGYQNENPSLFLGRAFSAKPLFFWFVRLCAPRYVKAWLRRCAEWSTAFLCPNLCGFATLREIVLLHSSRAEQKFRGCEICLTTCSSPRMVH